MALIDNAGRRRPHLSAVWGTTRTPSARLSTCQLRRPTHLEWANRAATVRTSRQTVDLLRPLHGWIVRVGPISSKDAYHSRGVPAPGIGWLGIELLLAPS